MLRAPLLLDTFRKTKRIEQIYYYASRNIEAVSDQFLGKKNKTNKKNPAFLAFVLKNKGVLLV